MRIGELSQRTGTSRRLLRYYEEQGMITPERSTNGYREYDPRFVDRVAQIRGLLDSGLPIRIIRQLLPCLDTPGTLYCADPTPQMIATLERERERMIQRVAVMERNRKAIDAYLQGVRRSAAEQGVEAVITLE